jgi:hypothetical protein
MVNRTCSGCARTAITGASEQCSRKSAVYRIPRTCECALAATWGYSHRQLEKAASTLRGRRCDQRAVCGDSGLFSSSGTSRRYLRWCSEHQGVTACLFDTDQRSGVGSNATTAKVLSKLEPCRRRSRRVWQRSGARRDLPGKSLRLAPKAQCSVLSRQLPSVWRLSWTGSFGSRSAAPLSALLRRRPRRTPSSKRCASVVWRR